MAQENSRWQELMNMQNTANMATAPAPDQPSGQFSGDEIEFESFMFDQGTGPLAANAALQADTAGTTEAAPVQQAAPEPAEMPDTPASDITGQEVPVPAYLKTTEATNPPTGPFGMHPTGPLGGLHTGTHLSERLSQASLQQQGSQVDANGAHDGEARHQTGGLGGATHHTGSGPLTSPSLTPTGPMPEFEPGATHQTGPINPGYFKSTTGPLGDSMLQQRTSTSPRLPSTPLNSAFLRLADEDTQRSLTLSNMASGDLRPFQDGLARTGWTDDALSQVEDFSTVLLSMLGNSAPQMAAHMQETTIEPEIATSGQHDWNSALFGNTLTASAPLYLDQPAPTEATSPRLSEVPPLELSAILPLATDYRGNGHEEAAPAHPEPHAHLETVAPAVEGFEQYEPTMQAAQETLTHEAPAQEAPTETAHASAHGQFNPDDMEFETFMFDGGAEMPVGIALTHANEPVQAEQNTVAEVQPPQAEPPMMFAPADVISEVHTPATFEQPQPAATVSPEQFATEPASMQAEEDAPAGALPFWLQETSDLEAIARQGYVDLGLDASQQPAQVLDLTHMEEAPAPVLPEPEAFAAEAYTPETFAPETFTAEVFTPQVLTPEPVGQEDFAPQAVVQEPEAYEQFAPDTHEPQEAVAQAAPEAPAWNVEEAEPVAIMVSPEPVVEEPQYVYEELPPIEPFDFAALNLVPEEEELGFNTEELSNLMPSRNDPMRATADLDVLADIFDGSPIGDRHDNSDSYNYNPVPSFSNPVAPPSAPVQTPIAAQLQQEAEQNAPHQGITPPQAGWTSTVTSALTMDSLDSFDDVFGESDHPTGYISKLPPRSTQALTEMDLDVQPFDFTQLNLDDEPESITGMLDTMKPRNSGILSTGEIMTADISPSAPQVGESMWTERPGSPAVQESELEDESWRGTERDTSLFVSDRQGANKPVKATGWLTEESPAGVNGGSAAQSTGEVFKARVARSETAEGEAPTQAPQSGERATKEPSTPRKNARAAKTAEAKQEPRESGSTGKSRREPEHTKAEGRQQAQQPAPAAQQPQVTVPEYAYQPLHEQQPVTHAYDMPSVGTNRDIYISGPLPDLEGFEELRAIVDSNPQDIGSHMALAAAYTQLGDMDTALRVYRRALKKRNNVSASVLRLITEELNDLAEEMNGQPHYHQVRADLYTRMGRHQEAAQEYNKIV